MRRLGLLLLAIGFTSAAVVTVRRGDGAGLAWQTIDWRWYVLALIVGVAGVALLRASARAADTHVHKLDADRSAMAASLERLVERLGTMVASWSTINVYDVHGRIDDELVGDLRTFADARESLIPLYGLQSYADLMSAFACGERYVNRAWSASADGYIDEVRTSLDTALAQLTKAKNLLAQYETP